MLIGIDGFGGSGKSTLAKMLKERLENTTVVEMDDFYLPSLRRPDYDRVYEQVLNPLAHEVNASYQRFDWQSDQLAEWHTIQHGGMVIVEGVFSTHPAIANPYDLKIWIECPPEIAMERGLHRDLTQYNIDTRTKWANEWLPREKQYKDTQKPHELADVIVDGLKLFE